MDGIVPTPFHMCVYTRIQDNLNRDGFLILKIFQVVLLLLLRVDDNLYQSVVYIYDYAAAAAAVYCVRTNRPQNILQVFCIHLQFQIYITHFVYVCVCMYTKYKMMIGRS